MSEQPNASATSEVATPVNEDKKEDKQETMEEGAEAVDAPSDAAAASSPDAEKPKGKAKGAAKKKAAAAPKKAAAAPKKAAAKKAAAPASPAKSDTPAATSPKAKAAPAAKKPAAKEASASASHPTYLEMVVAAVEALKERNGSSRQAILKYITSTYDLGVDVKIVNNHLKHALKKGVASGTLKNTKVSFSILNSTLSLLRVCEKCETT